MLPRFDENSPSCPETQAARHCHRVTIGNLKISGVQTRLACRSPRQGREGTEKCERRVDSGPQRNRYSARRSCARLAHPLRHPSQLAFHFAKRRTALSSSSRSGKTRYSYRVAEDWTREVQRRGLGGHAAFSRAAPNIAEITNRRGARCAGGWI